MSILLLSILFSDVANSANLTWQGEPSSTAAAWVDFNRDGSLDIWSSPHVYNTFTPPRLPKLFIQQRDGTFVDHLIWPDPSYKDAHGSQWADFDNDGDPDVVVLCGARGGVGQDPSVLFVNQAGGLQDRAAALGVDFPLGRGRNPLWVDWNRDGQLDLLQMNLKRPDGQAPSTLFQQTTHGFTDVNATAGFHLPEDALFAQAADLFGDGTLDLIVMGLKHSPVRVYEIGSSTLIDQTAQFPQFSRVRDAAIADFNGDTIPDLFLLRSKRLETSNLYQGDSKAVFARLITPSEAGVSFQATGPVSVDFHKRHVPVLPPEQIFIGSQGMHPTSSSFSVSPSDPTVVGLQTRTANSPYGLYLGYDPATQTWQAILANPDGTSRHIELILDAATSIHHVTPIGFTVPDLTTTEGKRPALLMYDSQTNQYVDQTAAAGLSRLIVGRSVVAGDFDNDMDVDLYITVGSRNIPLPSLLYENQGNGTFIPVTHAAGAAITRSGAYTYSGEGDLNAVMADYDRDGFLDLYIGNTTLEGNQQNYLGTPYHLFRNSGNRNHWLEIDLQGTVSNRDAIGAKVLVSAGGKVQMREQSGGMHAFSQDAQRLHFGLGSHTQAQQVTIYWPSGQVQTLSHVDADQILAIVEPSPSP